MEQTLAKTVLSAKLRSKVLWALAVCVYGSGDAQRLETVAEEGVALSRQAKDRVGEARTLGALGFSVLQLGELDRAIQVLEEALEIFRELGDEWASAHILSRLVVVSA